MAGPEEVEKDVEERANENEPIDLRDVNPTAVMEHDMPDSYN